MRARTLVALLAMSTAACSSGGDADLARPRPATTGPTPGADGTARPGPTTATTVAVEGCPGVPARRQPDPDRPRYILTLDIQPRPGTVTGTVDVRFVPDFESDRIVFRLWPNGPRQLVFGARLLPSGPVTVNGAEVPTTNDDPTKLVLTPTTPLRPGQALQVLLPFSLQLPQPARDRISAESDSVRMGSFFPILEWEPGRGWTDEPATSRFAEAGTAPAADFDITITTPDGYDVIASGVPDRPGHWTATGMRDISVAVGHFTTVTGTANAPDPVQVTVGVDRDAGDRPQPYLDRAIAALEAHSARYGPYPWPTFWVSVTPGISTGIEYPGHILHGPGTADDILTHEVAHQWFYALVGNNQGRDPWLDETPTTWAEARHEGTLEDYKATAIPADVRGRTGSPMTFWDGSQNFFLGAYVQGVQALAALGPPEQVDCALRIYAAEHAYRIATPADLVGVLTRVFPDAPATLARFGIRA
ncbi:MAG: hypothetical protein ACLGI2_05390 [Acidimicrobiia bacterium]